MSDVGLLAVMFTWLFSHWQPKNTKFIIGNQYLTTRDEKFLIPYNEVTDITCTSGFGRFEVVVHTYKRNYLVATFFKKEDASKMKAYLDSFNIGYSTQ